MSDAEKQPHYPAAPLWRGLGRVRFSVEAAVFGGYWATCLDAPSVICFGWAEEDLFSNIAAVLSGHTAHVGHAGPAVEGRHGYRPRFRLESPDSARLLVGGLGSPLDHAGCAECLGAGGHHRFVVVAYVAVC